MRTETPIDPRIQVELDAKLDAMSKVRELESKAYNLRLKAEEKMRKVYGVVLAEHGVDIAFHNVPNIWECPTSPVATCVYHHKDVREDFCIYCQDPRERK